MKVPLILKFIFPKFCSTEGSWAQSLEKKVRVLLSLFCFIRINPSLNGYKNKTKNLLIHTQWEESEKTRSFLSNINLTLTQSNLSLNPSL